MATYSSVLPLVTPDWLLEATDARRLRRVLETLEPAIGPAGPMSIEKCKVKLRVLSHEGCWIGSVPLQVRTGGAASVEEIVLGASFVPPTRRGGERGAAHGVFGQPGWACSIPDLGLELTSLADDDEPAGRSLLLDADRARGLIQDSIRSARPAWRRVVVSSCEPEETRHKLASRSTVRYRLQYEAGSADDGSGDPPPAVVVAKAYRAGAGTRTFSAMAALWESPLRRSGTVHIAEAIAYHPEVDVVVQGPIAQETTLKELIGEALASGDPASERRLAGLLGRSATGLAELHSSGVSEGPERRWDDELAEIDDRLQCLATAIPALEGLGRELVDHVSEVFRKRPLAGLVPSHGGFRAAQVLVAADEIGFIDFDSFCQADPAMDLAEFIRFLVQEGFGEPDDVDDADGRRRLVLLADLSAQAVAAYQATGKLDLERLVAWQALGWLNRLLAGWAKGKTDRLAIDAHLLDHFLEKWGLPASPFPAGDR